MSLVVWSAAAAAACLGLRGHDGRSHVRTAWLAAAVGLGWATIALGLTLGSFWAPTPAHRTPTRGPRLRRSHTGRRALQSTAAGSG